MKAKNLILCALAVTLGFITTVRAKAQVFSTLHSFSGADGQTPVAGLLLSAGTLYGTTEYGGSGGEGTVFAINTDGSGFTNLHSFSTTLHGANDDGALPLAGLVLSGGTLYGTSWYAGSYSWGDVFAVNAQNGGFAALHSFAGDQAGQNPQGGLALSGNTLFGTTVYGGKAFGTIYAVNTDSTGYTSLYSFSTPSGVPGTNGDGAYPMAALFFSGNVLYGTAGNGGASANGTVFKFDPGSGVLTTLHSFTGSDGANPQGGLVLAGNTLYGTTVGGGISNLGAVFGVTTDGSSFSTLYRFTNGADGAHPYSTLAISGSTLYGTQNGTGYGSVFKLNVDGSGFTTLYRFTNGIDGANPMSGVILSGYALYGTAEQGGNSSDGTVFSLSLAPPGVPPLSIQLSGPNVILTWPASVTGFTLQSAASLASPILWSSVSTPPVVVDGFNAVTNAVAGSAMFYRLSQ